MQKAESVNINSFLYRHRPYCGQIKPENLIFNANLQEFAQRVSYISNLETAGKLSPQESYQQIEPLWEQLKRSYLAIDSETDDELGMEG
jgi:hypothetical protein